MELTVKSRSKLGKWLDDRGITQEWLMKRAGVGRNTISDLASADSDRQPSSRTIKKIMNVIKEIDPDATADEFFNL